MANVLTSEEARLGLQIGAGDTKYFDWVDHFNGAVTAKLEACVGPIVQGTVTNEVHNGGRDYIYLNESPVVSIVQVVEYSGTVAGTVTAESNSSKPDPGYIIHKPSGKLWRRASGGWGCFPCGLDNITVTYVAGRYADTASVDDRFKSAALIMLKNAWRTFEDSTSPVGEFQVPTLSFPTFTVPTAVREMLADEWRTGSGTGD